jgi:hypothetical protein
LLNKPTLSKAAASARVLTQPANAILDVALGSGANLIAAKISGRIYIRLDLTPGDIAVGRWQEHTGMTAGHAQLERPSNSANSG